MASLLDNRQVASVGGYGAPTKAALEQVVQVENRRAKCKVALETVINGTAPDELIEAALREQVIDVAALLLRGNVNDLRIVYQWAQATPLGDEGKTAATTYFSRLGDMLAMCDLGITTESLKAWVEPPKAEPKRLEGLNRKARRDAARRKAKTTQKGKSKVIRRKSKG